LFPNCLEGLLCFLQLEQVCFWTVLHSVFLIWLVLQFCHVLLHWHPFQERWDLSGHARTCDGVVSSALCIIEQALLLVSFRHFPDLPDTLPGISLWPAVQLAL
jgi:hypothetical protein